MLLTQNQQLKPAFYTTFNQAMLPIKAPQYHIDVSNFGEIPDKLLKIIDSS